MFDVLLRIALGGIFAVCILLCAAWVGYGLWIIGDTLRSDLSIDEDD